MKLKRLISVIMVLLLIIGLFPTTAFALFDSHTVTFVDPEGNVLGTDNVSWGWFAEAPSVPPREGYDFKGWNKLLGPIYSNTTITAVFEIKHLRTRFYDWDGDLLDTRSVDWGQTASTPSDPKRRGWTFTGWDKPLTGIKEPTDFHALYTQDTYTVTFDLGGHGTTSDPTAPTVLSGGSVTPPTVKGDEDNGYRWIGWDGGYTDVYSNTTVKAVYKYRVTFNPDVNKGEISDGDAVQWIEPGKNANPPKVQAKTGWEFVKWNDGYKKVNGPVEITAVYKPRYNVTIGPGPHGKVEDSTSSFTEMYTVGEDVDLGDVDVDADNGYYFDYWLDNQGGHLGRYAEPEVDGEESYTAIFSPTEQVVHILPNENGELRNGGGLSGWCVVTRHFGDNINLYDIAQPVATKEGYEFSHWEEGNSVFGDWKDVTTGNVITVGFTNNFRAVFSLKKYRVVFDLGGHATLNAGSAPLQQDVNYGKSAKEPSFTAHDGYTFAGWSRSFENIKDADSSATITVKAKYKYRVRFLKGDGNDLSGTTQFDVGPETYSVPASQVPTPNPFTGYHFTAWSGSYTNVTGPVDLTAQYELNTYTVHYVDWNGGFVADVPVQHGSTANPPTHPTRTGFDPAGWDKGTNGSDGILTNVTGDETVTARYTPQKRSVTFALGGHATIGDVVVQVDYDGSLTDSQIPKITGKEGYSFNSWDRTSFEHITENIVVNAIYDYKVTFKGGLHGSIAGDPVRWAVHNGSVTAPAVNPDPGYTPNGWDKPLTNIIAPQDITAQYTGNNYTVTFDAESGNVSPLTQNKKFGSTYGKNTAGAPESLPTPTRKGYDFKGWYLGDNGTGALVTNDTAVATPSNHYLYAKWQAQTVIVTFNAGTGGTVYPASQVKLFDSKYSYGRNLPTPRKDGYTFEGWYTSEDSTGTLVTNDTIVTNDLDHTLFARWTANTYRVTFDAQFGSVTPAYQDKKFDSTYGKNPAGAEELLPTPTRYGYDFAGWYTLPFGMGSRVKDDTQVTTASNHKLYAKWNAQTVGVSFDPEDGTVSPDSQTKLFGSLYGLGQNGLRPDRMPVPEREGFFFLGWWTGDNGTGYLVTNLSTVMNAEDHVLHARWTGNVYKVTLDANGGDVSPDTLYKKFASTYGKSWDGITDKPLPTPTRDGYDFSGWFTEDGNPVTNETTVTIPANHKLIAKWTARTVDVSFDAEGGPTTPAAQTKLFDSTYGMDKTGNAEELLPVLTRDGYTFGGWWTEDNGTGTEVKNTTPVKNSKNHTLYAKWTANTVDVSFDAEGGPVTPTVQTKLFDSTYGMDKTGKTEEYLPVLTRDGYTFGGWWTQDNGTGTEVKNTTPVKNSKNHTLYAKWTANTVDVSFDAEGGPVTPAMQTKLFDSTYGKDAAGAAALLPVIERTGYTFGGWWTGDNGTGTEVKNDTQVKNSADHTLYAKWTINNYEVKFDLGAYGTRTGGGELTQSIPYLGTAAAPLFTVADTWTFIGWDKDIKAPITEATTFTAQYARQGRTLTAIAYPANGGTLGKNINGDYTIDSSVNLADALPTPATGYNFAGWEEFTAPDTWTPVSGSTVKIDESNIFRAVFSIKTFTVTFNEGANGAFDPDGADAVQTVSYGASATAPTVDTDTGYRFTGWNKGFANVTSNLSVTAEYAIRRYTLSVNVQGNGTVTGIAGRYDYGEEVDLGDAVTTPDDGYEFTGFVDAAGNDIYTVDMTGNRTVTAVFSTVTPAPAPSPSAAPSTAPAASPSVSPAPTTTIDDGQLPQAAPAVAGGQSTFSLYWLFLIIGLPLLLLLFLLLLLAKRKKDKENQPQR